MKARIRLQDRISNGRKADIKAYAKQVAQKENSDNARRFLKIVCVVLHNHFGFGRERLLKVMTEIGKLSNERDNDEIFWSHIDKVIIEQLNIPLQEEDYVKMGE